MMQPFRQVLPQEFNSRRLHKALEHALERAAALYADKAAWTSCSE
jgi:hypothetical protein